MARFDKDTFVFSRVPKEARASFLTVTLVNMGGSTALSQFMLGATLGHGMTFWQAMFATCLGSLALEFVSLGLGFMGMKEGLSTSLLARWCGFGRTGSALIGIVIVISCLGWFGIQNSVLAEGISYALNGRINFGWVATFSGIALTFLVASGFRGLGLTAKIAVPLFFAVILYIFLDLVFKDHIINEAKSMTSFSLSQAATMVAGGFMAGALTMPDISRYCKNNNHVFWMITLCIIVGEFLINAISVLIAQAFNSADIVSMMTINAGFIGLAAVILSAVKINDINLYSSSLGLANSLQGLTGKKFSYAKLTVCLGIVGTILSVLGILDHFIDFLSILGIIFPPIAGVMMVDYYILRTNRKLLEKTKIQGLLTDESSISLIGWSAIVACVAGTTIGAVFEYGIPSLNSVIAAGIVYWLLVKIKKNFHRQLIFLSL